MLSKSLCAIGFGGTTYGLISLTASRSEPTIPLVLTIASIALSILGLGLFRQEAAARNNEVPLAASTHRGRPPVNPSNRGGGF